MPQSRPMKEFKTKDGDEMPFQKGEGGYGPSGSRWTTKHLNWLAVHFQDECDIEDVFSPDFDLSDQIVKYIREKLLADPPLIWDQIRGKSSDFDDGDLFKFLLDLETGREKQQYYSPSTGSSAQKTSSQQSESSSVFERQLSLTPTPRPRPFKESDKLATRSSPLGPKPSKLPEVLKGNRVSKQVWKRVPSNLPRKTLFEVKGPPGPWSEDTFRPIRPSSQAPGKHTTAPAESPSDFTSKRVEFGSVNGPPWETSSDTAYTDRFSQPSESESESESDSDNEEGVEGDNDGDPTYENQVVFAALAFFNITSNAIKSVVGDLPLSTRQSRKLFLQIEGVKMTSHPDLSLSLGTKNSATSNRDPEIELVIECKREKNTLSADRKLGQEYSELLGDSKRQWAYGKPRETYTSYLISWHHLDCYISRLDVSKEYLDKLDSDTKRLQDGPHPLVKRSRKYDLTNPDHRIQFALLAPLLLIHQMKRYKRHKELVKRLLG